MNNLSKVDYKVFRPLWVKRKLLLTKINHKHELIQHEYVLNMIQKPSKYESFLSKNLRRHAFTFNDWTEK